jgi:hypothetical protein
MRIFYQIIVFYLAVHGVLYMFRERKFWKQAGAALVLILLFLRLVWIK